MFSFSLLAFLALLSALLAPTALVAAQATNDLSWVLFDRKQFDGNVALDPKGDVQLFWKTGDEYSTYGIASRSTGFLALGFSETGAMTGADIALGYQDSTGKFILENRHATGFVAPQLSDDQKNNIRLKEGMQKSGVTAFVFEKKNKADCLQNQVDVSKDSWQWFIYSFSNSNTFAIHEPGKMGKKYVKLGTTKTVSVNEVRDVEGSKNFTIVQAEITVPSNETTYCYTLHKLPAGKKNFIIGDRPSSSSKLLHHLVVYSCYGLPEAAKSMVGQKANCDYQNFENPCAGFVTEWAPGIAGRTFEPGFGKPFGSDSFDYVMLETHYNNPEGLKDEKDSSGYTFIYTDKQVDTEIGTLTLGDLQVTGWTLEPGKEIVAHSTVCTPECTNRWPSAGITAFSVFFHMHQRGRNERVQIIRDGKEIDALSSIRNFEYGYQYSKSIGEVKLLPGDKLITTCEYNTSKDTKPVPGGLASKAEMCFAWVDYYPANNVLACTQYDLSKVPNAPLNGTAALCLEANKSPDSYILKNSSLTTPFQGLPPHGNTCAALATTTSAAPSATSTAKTSGSTPSFPTSVFSSYSQTLFMIAAALAFTMHFTL